MPEVITIGSTLIDVFLESDEFTRRQGQGGELLCQLLGDKVEIEHFALTSGGGASNTAVGFARQGFQTAIMSELGVDVLAELALKELGEEGVNLRYLTQEKRETTGLSVILVAPDGQRTILVHRSAASMLEERDINWRAIQQAKWVHLANVSGEVALINRAFETVQGTSDPGLSWNPGKGDIDRLVGGQLSLLEEAVDILILNEEEWERCGPKQQELQQTIREIVITAGSKGGRVIVNGKPSCQFKSQKVQAREVTGAGDAFCVGYVSQRLRGGGEEDCYTLARANAASVVQAVGAKAGLLHQEAEISS